MLIAQITDLHIRAGRNLAYGRVDTARALERAIDHVMALDPAPDVVLFTGDIGDLGIAAEYAEVADILAALTLPYYMVPGNHDRRAALHDAFPHAIPAKKGDFLHYILDDFPLRMIGLDTLDEGYGHGVLCQRRLAWLENQLAQNPLLPHLIFMHHPPITSFIAHMDALKLRGEADNRTNAGDNNGLAHLFRQYRGIVGVLCGHLHRPLHCVWHGVPVNVAPSIAHQVVADFREHGPAAFNMEPAAIQLHFWSPDLPEQGLLTHTSYIGDFAGPYPFFDATGALIS
ncbi:phosphodiesterase [Thalassospira mesophila]|uniref:Calcineurin-like phosphoesterase domain-containing protein n=1 Tax=Thalassospira mesophila TaxID=1293891 RepID=A0A1Y2L0M4_9PROT|nr:phosphodiesterase [Thalassospira mesophila]OSQ38789.1 hypothetical protein TMES_08355 [Thalassospira mesophila]